VGEGISEAMCPTFASWICDNEPAWHRESLAEEDAKPSGLATTAFVGIP
jgi:hypothetical protein